MFSLLIFMGYQKFWTAIMFRGGRMNEFTSQSAYDTRHWASNPELGFAAGLIGGSTEVEGLTAESEEICLVGIEA
jgi:hypothetical protein